MIQTNIKEKALEIANKYYPEAKCVILTGSQLEPEFLSPVSDIDILLIGSQFNNVSSDGLKEENYKIDFTRVDYLNLINILIDSSYNPNSILIYMLKDGVILKDETGIAKLAKAFCEYLFVEGNKGYHNELRSLKTGLTKLKKHFLKKLDRLYNPFILGDFLKLMASSYLFIRDNGWFAHDGFRQVKKILITEKNAPFLNDMAHLAHGFINNPSDNVDIILNYIDKYLSILGKPQISSHFDKKLIININFRSQNLNVFYRDICHSILMHPYLSNFFMIGQIHNYRHIFKNKYSLIFNNKLEGYDEIVLMKELYSLFFKERKRILDLDMVNPAYAYKIFGNEDVFEKVEDLLSYVSHEIILRINLDKRYNPHKIFLIGMIISIIMLKSFKINPDKVPVLADYLMKKWMPSDYIQSINYENIGKLSTKLVRDFHNSYINNKSIFDEIQKEFILNGNMVNDEIDLNKISNYCQDVIQSINNSTYKLSDLNILSVDINTITLEEKTSYWYLSNTLEMMLNTIGIETENRSYFAYVLGCLYK